VRRDNPSNITRIVPSNTDYLADCWSSYLDINNSDLNILGLHGPFLDEVISGNTEETTAVADSSTSAAAAAVSSAAHSPPPHCPSAATASASCDAPLNLFDKLDLIIFCYLKETHWESFKNSGNYIKYFNFLTLSEKPVSENDFSLFRVLGRGGFGVVNGCKKCQTGQLYAMKVLDRKRIKMKKSETLCMTERNILIMIDSPFVVCMKYAYATASELFLILDLMVGGDLGYHLYRKGMFNQRETKYYICRTLLGLKALHDLNIVFRDLKPDNILMDGHGRTKLSDLGLAVRVPRNGLTGACGTRGYWAPEMLRRDPSGYRIRYNLSVDWFSFGCLLYEFMTGICPFRTEVARNWGGFGKKEKEKAIDLAVQEMDPFFDTEIFDPTTQDLISKLLMKDGRARLGANGSGEVMAHAYFDDINWEEYIHDLVPAPCLPRKDLNVASQSEIGYFGDDANAKKLELNEGDMELFAKWDYIRPAAFLEEVVQFMQYEELRVTLPPPTPSLSLSLANQSVGSDQSAVSYECMLLHLIDPLSLSSLSPTSCDQHVFL
jgi:beta-adrenergic-receptor kinase